MLSLNSKLRTNWLLPNIWKITPLSKSTGEKYLQTTLCSPALMSSTEPPASVGLHQVWDVYKHSSSTSWTEVNLMRGWGWKSNKQKVRSDHIRNELNEAGNIKQPSKNQPSSVYFVSPCLSALFTSSSCSANRSHDWCSIFQPPGLLWSWYPRFGAGTGISHLELLGAAFSNQSLALQWHLSSSS